MWDWLQVAAKCSTGIICPKGTNMFIFLSAFVFLEEHIHRIFCFCNSALFLATLCKGDHLKTGMFMFSECEVQISPGLHVLLECIFSGMSVGGKMKVSIFHIVFFIFKLIQTYLDHLLVIPSLFLVSFISLYSNFLMGGYVLLQSQVFSSNIVSNPTISRHTFMLSNKMWLFTVISNIPIWMVMESFYLLLRNWHLR